MTNGTDVALSRALIRRKAEGQTPVVAHLDDQVSAAILDHLARLDEASTTEVIRGIEAEAAATYWSA